MRKAQAGYMQNAELLEQELFFYARTGDLQSLKTLLESGVSVNMIDPESTDSPLMIACKNGHVEVVKICLEYGAKNDPHPDYGHTALHASVFAKQLETSRILLEEAALSEADAIISNLTDANGHTPIHLAAIGGMSELLELLLRHGADIACVDRYGQTCLHLGAGCGNVECLAVLLDNAGDFLLELRDVNGNTPLHHAAFNGKVDAVRLLLETAANVMAKNFKGQTAHALAVAKDCQETVALLLEYHDFHSDGGAAGGANGNGSNIPSTPAAVRRASSAPSDTLLGGLPRPHTVQKSASNSGLLVTPSAKGEKNYGYRVVTKGGGDNNANLVQQSLTSPATPAAGAGNYDDSRNSSPAASVGYGTPYGGAVPIFKQAPLFSPELSRNGRNAQSNLYRYTDQQQQPLQTTSSPGRNRTQSAHAALAPSPGEGYSQQQQQQQYGALPQPVEAVRSFSFDSSNNHLHYHHQRNQSMPESTFLPPPPMQGEDNEAHNRAAATLLQRRHSDHSLSVDAHHDHIDPALLSTPSKRSHGEGETGGGGAVDDYAEPLETFEYEDMIFCVYLTETGDAYYLVNETGHSQWEDPREYGFVEWSEGETHYNEDGTTVAQSPSTPAVARTGRTPPPAVPSPRAGSTEKGSHKGEARETFDFAGAVGGDEGDHSEIDNSMDGGSTSRLVPTKINWGIADGDTPEKDRRIIASGGSGILGGIDRCNKDTAVLISEDSDEEPLPTRRVASKTDKRSQRGGGGGGKSALGFQSTAGSNSSSSSAAAAAAASGGGDVAVAVAAPVVANAFPPVPPGASALPPPPPPPALPPPSDITEAYTAATNVTSSRRHELSESMASDHSDAFLQKVASLRQQNTMPKSLALRSDDENAATVGGSESGNSVNNGAFDAQGQQPQQQHTKKKKEGFDAAKVEHYMSQIRAGASIRVLGELMDDADEPRTFVVHVLGLADEYEMNNAMSREEACAGGGGGATVTSSDSGGPGDVSSRRLPPPPPTQSIDELKQHPTLGKYAKMCAMGVPLPSVLSKMGIDGTSVTDRNAILRALGQPEEKAVSASAAPPAVETKTIDELKQDTTLGKYARMCSMGVPLPSVLSKMSIDGLDISQKNTLLRALGQPEESSGSEGGTEEAGTGAVGKSNKNGSFAPTSRPSAAFQSLHWNTLPADKLKNSIWAMTSISDSSISATELSAASGAHMDIAETELEELEKLFGAASVQNSKMAADASSAKIASLSAKNAEMLKLKLLEGKRAQNITIGLVAFKSFGSHVDILKAICSLDTLNNRLTVDDLDNFRNLLPTDAEMKRIGDISGSKHPAELFLQAALMFYPELPKKLNSFSVCLGFGPSCQSFGERSKKLISSCNQVLSSNKLAKLFKKMLMVGNVMNQGTFRGDASGFTLDSLLKMINTKGVDKKTSILDYVVKNLYDKSEERLLGVIEDLSLVDECAKLNSQELLRDFDALNKNFAALQADYDRNMAVSTHSPVKRAAEFTSPTARAMVSQFHDRLGAYLIEFKQKLSEAQRSKLMLSKKANELIDYFGEDRTSCDNTKIFSVLQEFRRALAFSKESVEWKISREAANAPKA